MLQEIFSTIHILLQFVFNLGHTFVLVLSTDPATCMLEYLSYMPEKQDTLYVYMHMHTHINFLEIFNVHHVIK